MVQLSESERSRMKAKIEQHQEPRHPGTWRKPRQPGHPPPNEASLNSGGNLIKLEPTTEEPVELRPGESEAESVDKFTSLDSDESVASISG